MKLNQDCVRDILLFIEDKYVPGKVMYVDEIIKGMEEKGYSPDTSKYALSKLYETDYTTLRLTVYNGIVMDGTSGALTWEGHEFLDNIRDKSIWEKVKKDIKNNVGSASINLLGMIAENYILRKFNLK